MKSSLLRVTDGETEAREGKGRPGRATRIVEHSTVLFTVCPAGHHEQEPSGCQTQVARSRDLGHAQLCTGPAAQTLNRSLPISEFFVSAGEWGRGRVKGQW